MNGALQVALNVATAVLLFTGALSCLLGALGLVRFPDTLSRLQAASKPQTLGVLLILLGAALQVSHRYVPVLLLTAAFQLFTSPVTGQSVGRTAYLLGEVDPAAMEVDELRSRLASANRSSPGSADSNSADSNSAGSGSPG